MMTVNQMTDREKMIAEIREALRRVELGTYRITAFADLEYWLRFLLSELERLEREYAEERAAHNAHVAELCELEQERDKLIEALRQVDTHIRATPDPVPYIVDTLKRALPEYRYGGDAE